MFCCSFEIFCKGLQSYRFDHYIIRFNLEVISDTENVILALSARLTNTFTRNHVRDHGFNLKLYCRRVVLG